MEIADYLKVARRRLWILVLVPVLAAGAALAYGVLSPRTYSATATVLTPSLVGTQYSQFSGPQAISQFVSALAASAADPTVLGETAKETGISAETLTDNVSVSQVGASSNMKLTYRSEDKAASQRVAHALATNALMNIYTAQGNIADLQAEAAKKALDTANQAVNDYVVKAGVGEPSAAYQAAISQVAWLQQTQANYRATGETASANLMKGPIQAAQDQARTIGATLPQYNILLAAQSQANETYQVVLGDQRKVKVQAAAAADPGVIQTGDVNPDVTTSSIAKLVVPVFGAAVLFAIILIALFEFIAAIRRQASVKEEPQQSGAPALAAEPKREQGPERELEPERQPDLMPQRGRKPKREPKPAPALAVKPERASWSPTRCRSVGASRSANRSPRRRRRLTPSASRSPSASRGPSASISGRARADAAARARAGARARASVRARARELMPQRGREQGPEREHQSERELEQLERAGRS